MITIQDVKRAQSLLSIESPIAILKDNDVLTLGLHIPKDLEYTVMREDSEWTTVRSSEGRVYSFSNNFDDFKSYWNRIVEFFDTSIDRLVERKERERTAAGKSIHLLKSFKERIWDITSELSS